MADVIVKGDTSGAVTLSAPAVAGTVTVTLPATSGTMAVTAGSPSFTDITATGNLTVNGNTTLGDASTDTILMTGAPSIGGAGLGMGMGFRNRILNGSMVIDQRNAGASSTTPTINVQTYGSVDRFAYLVSQASKFTMQQTPSATETGFATRVGAGFSNYLACTVGASANVTVSATDFFAILQPIEGLNVGDLAWGTANAKTITFSFWVNCSLTGTFGGSLRNASLNRSYPFTYTISAANTWEQKSITIAGETSGTWLTTNGVGMYVQLNLGYGSTYSNTPNAWVTGNFGGANGCVNWVSTNSATFYITGVQLEKGSTATSFDYRPYGTELQLCQRYFYKHQNTNGGASYPIMLQVYSTTAAFGKICDLPVTMRTFPTTSTTATSGTFTPSLANGTAAGAFTGTNIETSTTNALCTGAWTGSSGLVAGNVTTVAMPNNAFFSASAEL